MGGFISKVRIQTHRISVETYKYFRIYLKRTHTGLNDNYEKIMGKVC